MGIMSWDLDGGLNLFRIIGDRRTIRPTPCQGSTMDDESTGPLVPEERETTTSGLDRIQAKFADSVDDLSDRELITAIHLTGTANRSGYEFELQRRFVERITTAINGGTRVAWALVAGTVVLGVATILLVIAAW